MPNFIECSQQLYEACNKERRSHWGSDRSRHLLKFTMIISCWVWFKLCFPLSLPKMKCWGNELHGPRDLKDCSTMREKIQLFSWYPRALDGASQIWFRWLEPTRLQWLLSRFFQHQLVVWLPRLQCCGSAFLNDSTSSVNQITFQSDTWLAGLFLHSVDLSDCTEYTVRLPEGYVNTAPTPASTTKSSLCKPQTSKAPKPNICFHHVPSIHSDQRNAWMEGRQQI